ncbi:MAG: mercury methylation corrinoid protein HgcA [Coriobacteriia bacterium]
MAECGDTKGSACCGGGGEPVPDDFGYGPAPYLDGAVDTLVGPVPRVRTDITREDRLGGLRMRANIGRGLYRVRPGLYAVGDPDDTAPVLVTANYKLTFDALRRELGGRDVWLLVLDTRGVNVWCAAGKGTFGTDELVRRVRDVRLEQIVSHRKLVLPQLGATGVSAHAVRERTGASVVWGPVRASDVPAFLDAGLKATPAMRRVTFDFAERARLVGVELSALWRPQVLVGVAAYLAITDAWRPIVEGRILATPSGIALVTLLVSLVAGAAIVPLLLPWIPGRAFALKGGIVGALAAASVVAIAGGRSSTVGLAGMALVGTALASYIAMNFTGSSTFTSPSGVEWEMRRAIPLQIVGVVAGVVMYAAATIPG